MKRLEGLDALRGIAALLVLVQHFLWVLLLNGQAWTGVILSSINLGALGIALFFLISGFVIPFSLGRGLAAFGISRAARLLPALWVSMLFAIALGAVVVSPGQILANAFMVAEPLKQERLIGPYWSLGWELGFYCIVALVFAAGQLKPRTFGLMSLAVGLVGSLYHAAFSYLILMFCGALLRMILLEKNEAAKMWLRVSIVTLAGVWYLWRLTTEHPPVFFFSMALAFPVFLLCWNRFSHPALLWLGSISYSLYLFHLPILEALATLPPLAFTFLGLGLPILVAAVIYRWVEKPAMAWGKALSRHVIRQPREVLT